MTGDKPLLDPARVRELFDLRSPYVAFTGGGYTEDPHPIWDALRATGPVHPGTVHQLSGVAEDYFFHGLPYPESPHYSVFSFAECDAVYRDPETFTSSAQAVDFDEEAGVLNSMISMGGARHRRYRQLVQPSFLPARAKWWMENWIVECVGLLIDSFATAGRAELNVDFCAAIPVLTITGSFGLPVEQALDVRAATGNPEAVIAMIAPIVAARRAEPQDDLISILVQAEVVDDDGVKQQLSDAEIYSFALLLLAAGSGTTWKQMGITLTALLQRPDLLARVRDDRSLVRPLIEECLRWEPTDPMFSRWVAHDTELAGVQIPAGAVVHLCIGAANRDPARWDDVDALDIARPPKASMAFGNGQHICLGMHVARAEMTTAVNALLDRLPNLRLDPDAEQPRLVGFYERGATEIPVLFDAAGA